MEGRSQGLRKGTWTAEEDSLLRKCIDKYGEGKWHQVPSRAGLNRCRKSCRLRWLNYLKPSIKRGRLSIEEVDLVIRLHRLLGNRWSLIAGRLPGRTANDVKNFWNTHLSKKQDHKSNCNIKPTCNENITFPTAEAVQKINVIKPRPRSFSNIHHQQLLNTSPEITFPGGTGSSSRNKENNENNNSNHKDSLYVNKTCNKYEYDAMNTGKVGEGEESMWWESLLEESEVVGAGTVAEEETSGMNSAANLSATFDVVDLWNLLNADDGDLS